MEENTLTHRGLTGKLYTIKDSPFWRLLFRHPASRKRQRISLGTSDLPTAKAKAKAILDKTADAGLAALKEFARRGSAVTVGEACDHYQKVSTVASRKSNVNALLVVLRHATGEEDREKLRAMSISRLNRKLVADFLRKSELRPQSKKTNLAAARAVFCRAVDWEGFELPDLSQFREASMKTGIRVNLDAFVPLPAATLEEMERRSKMAGGGIRRAFLLARRCGMTPKEIAACRKGWLEKRGEKYELLIVQRPEEDFTLKTGSRRQRQIALPPTLAAELLEAEDYMVPGTTAYMRHNWCMRVMNAWLREFLPERRDLLYCLRKQAGSDLLNATGRISTVSRFLGHTTSSTTERHYATMDHRVELPEI